ncbi:MAG: hypothetical protein HYV62_12990 [Candidatus Rokubacteria bacterium]|nr:hypothetical protein [Candidatus Rokubacteria bacterium]
MNKPRLVIRIAIAVGVAGVLVAVGLLALPALVDVNQYRGLIQSQAEQALGRRVTLGRMSLSVFPSFGIKVDEPEVKGALRARSLTVVARLLPWFSAAGSN